MFVRMLTSLLAVPWAADVVGPPVFPEALVADALAPPHQQPDPMPLVPGVPDVEDPSISHIVLYEGNVFPEDLGWERTGTFDCDRWIDGGAFWQLCELGIWEPPPFGEMDWYNQPLARFAGEEAFFIEWRMRSDAPGWIVDVPVHGTPCVLTASGNSGVNYHFTISRDLVRVIRHLSLPTVWVEIDPDVAHTYRLELFSDPRYVWYIDGEEIDSGDALGAYPTSDSLVKWGARFEYEVHTMKWDYVRFGKLPAPGTGDYNSNGAVEIDDYSFFYECVLGSDIHAGPGCVFADFDGDDDVDLRDFAEFENAFSAGEGV